MDALGQEIAPGDIIIYTGNKSSGYSATVVKSVGASRIKLTSRWPSRKDKDNVIVITEEQLISMRRRAWMNQVDDNGMIYQRRYVGRDENGPIYEETYTPIEERVQNSVRKDIQLSRLIKKVPLEEYEPTTEEMEELQKILNKK